MKKKNEKKTNAGGEHGWSHQINCRQTLGMYNLQRASCTNDRVDPLIPRVIRPQQIEWFLRPYRCRTVDGRRI